jgi:hypothetical protein
VCPRKRGICSGTRPRSLRGITANAPPPLDSQLTERYSGFACSNLSARVLPASWVRASADLDQIGVPCIRRDVEVIVALFLLRNRVSAYSISGKLWWVIKDVHLLRSASKDVTWRALLDVSAAEDGHKTPHTVFGSSHEAAGHDFARRVSGV